MNRLPNPEKIAKRLAAKYPESYYSEPFIPHKWVIEALKEYGRQIRDLTLEWAAENVETEFPLQEGKTGELIDDWHVGVNRESILAGKQSKDLEI